MEAFSKVRYFRATPWCTAECKGSRLSEFSLEKYYMDAVTEAGDHFIGYFAVLHFGPISLCYSDTMHGPVLQGIFPGPILNCASRPSFEDGIFKWRHAQLGFEGDWEALSPAFEEELLYMRGRSVNWSVLQPSSRVKITTTDGNSFSGLGSCERLMLTIPPWKLGLKELIWGRFVSETNSVVWLEWKGQYPLRLTYWNGVSMEPELISESKVVAKDLEVAIRQERILRSGTIGSEVLSKVPKVSKLAPLALLVVHECKKLGRGVLQTTDGTLDMGWVIHEKVTWP